ncbi:hypothetical protein F751_2323 [Auxenochlorella protothecoides]|uniref:Uncharacterized protein n=1 Tax=Auxenochlorella protothecoides TaxID=3075 RepID=A0A087SFV1_AUXPR|nr:hypothetical protein F751_2323 [Auxenochlorella protothecoides]KFM24605.1 hypothetical protein F751_2323 [Auxenochlorella protothecoides]
MGPLNTTGPKAPWLWQVSPGRVKGIRCGGKGTSPYSPGNLFLHTKPVASFRSEPYIFGFSFAGRTSVRLPASSRQHVRTPQ